MLHSSKNKDIFTLFLVFPLIVGAISALLSGNIASSYASFEMPSFSPPGIVFPIVWTILYLLMGVSSYLIFQTNSRKKNHALNLYLFQLCFNFFWSIFFFRFSWYLFSFFWLLTLIAILLFMISSFSKINALSAWLQIPYVLWCIFAAILNFAVYRLN